MTVTSLIKSPLHNSIAEAILGEVTKQTAQYYYYLGRTVQWGDELNPPFPTDSFKYELDSRKEIILTKRITASDVSLVVPRIDWKYGFVYDQYDDAYSDTVESVDLIDGGIGYLSEPTITFTGGGGTGAAAEAVVVDGSVIQINVTNKGSGYTSAPTVSFSGGNPTTPATAVAGVVIASSGANRMEDTQSYVITDDFNVYMCIDNNGGQPSLNKPSGVYHLPLTTADGYKWKFMYSLPIAARNKFLSEAYMPVISALTGQYYSRGELSNVSIRKAGSGYTFGSIVVAGDGYKTGEELYVQSANPVNMGSGYTTATVTFSAPVTDPIAWSSGGFVTTGVYVSVGNFIYEVVAGGTLGTVAPVHKYDVEQNGTTSLKFYGETVTGNAVIGGGQITAINLIAQIRDFNIIEGGSGYISNPVITLQGGGGTGAVVEAVIRNGSLFDITVFDSGADYTSVPTVVVGTPWEATTAYLFEEQITSGGRLYTVTVPGTTSSTPPSHTSGSVVNGTATLEYAGLAATASANLRYGTGYNSNPTVTIVGDGAGANYITTSAKTEAKLRPVFESGSLVGIEYVDVGVGYTSATLGVTGDGTEAEIVANLSIGDVTTLQSSNEILVVDGSIYRIAVSSGGYNYTAATITIDGDGQGATASPVLSNGRLIGVTVTSPGNGYRWARITVSGDGFGAEARAIISPFGGTGRYIVDNLFAKTLMFSSNVSRDLVRGFTVNNDYRQFGIIKNPYMEGTTTYARANLLTACWSIGAVINTSTVAQDDVLENQNGRRFRVVSFTSSGALLQSLDNAEVNIGDILTGTTAYISVQSATAPDIDKYSGDIMFIDNQRAFTPTSSEAVILRTILQF